MIHYSKQALIATTAVLALFTSGCASIGSNAANSVPVIKEANNSAEAVNKSDKSIDSFDYKNTSLDPVTRAKDLVSRMTLEEKSKQIGNNAPAIDRLGVPEYNWWNEGLHGVARAGIATVFPQAIGMASTFDTARMKDTANTISDEFRAKYLKTLHPNGGSGFYQGLTVWSPNINIFRDPRWGRGQETYGEDPILSGEMGTAFIHGLQGDNDKFFKTIATSKHFAVHSGPESGRHQQNVNPSKYDLEDTYLPAFRKTVIDGKVNSMMCVYNSVDGIPGCANNFLMNERLRADWGFKGFVVSDCGAAANIYRKDALNYEPDPVKAVSIAIKSGMDLICGDYRNGMTTEAENIVKAVNSGALDQATLDNALTRLFEARIRLGMFDDYKTLPFAGIKATDFDTPANGKKSLEMAKASMVLLKNENNMLPLKSEPKSIAVIGPNADSFDALVGNYYGTPSNPVTVLDGIKARFKSSKVEHVQGTGLIGPPETEVGKEYFCVDSKCEKPGLTAEHFGNDDLRGSPVETKIEEKPYVQWRSDGRKTSIRWTGYIKAPESGKFQFRFASENGYRVYVDDKPVVEEWGVGDAPSILSCDIKFEAGKVYPIRVEAFQRGQRGEQQLVWNRPSDNGAHAVEVAKKSDLVVFVGGLSARIEGEEMKIAADGFTGGDRTKLDLPAPQQKLLEQLKATGKPVVLVLMNGSALSVNWADKNIPAIVEAWYPGGEGGHAVAGLLAGDYSPAGRLPVTFYKTSDDLPAFDDYKMEGRTYRYFKGEVLYPFGHGLSYTKFAYSNARVEDGANGAKVLKVDLTNNGSMDGEEVAQVYVTHPEKPGTAIRALKAFKRLKLGKGETKTVEFVLDERALSYVDKDGVRRISPEKIDVWVGGGQPIAAKNIPQVPGVKLSIALNSTKVLPR